MRLKTEQLDAALKQGLQPQIDQFFFRKNG